MNLKDFFTLVNKYKWLIIAVCFASVLSTFLLVRNLPNQYKSQAKIATGLLDPSRQLASDNSAYASPDLLVKLNQQFTNIIDIMLMPKNMSVLSYRLLLHDLQNSDKAFSKISEQVAALTAAQRLATINILETRLKERTVLTPLDDLGVDFYNLVRSMKYDQKSISKNLSISHQNNSDFLTVEYVSDNTLLSVFVVNTLSNDFINNYTYDLVSNKNKSILVLDSLVKVKEAVVNQKNQALKNYKIKNRVLNLDKQSQIAYQQLVDFENKKSQALFDLQALQTAIANVNAKLNSRKTDSELGAIISEDNQEIILLKGKIQAANNRYIDGGFQRADKRLSDSLQQLLNAQLVKANDNYTADPLITKQALLQQRISLGVELDKVKGSVKNIDEELAILNSRFATMVPFDAGIQQFEREADVATREYLDLLNHYNQANLDKSIGLKLHLEQEGAPSLPETSKKMVLIVLSFFASLICCFILLLLINFFYSAIYTKEQLAAYTNGRIIGEISSLKNTYTSLERIWKGADENEFKQLIRSARFDIGQQMASKNNKLLGITGFAADNSKHFTVASLAYGFSQLGAEVLLIGGANITQYLDPLKIQVNQSLNAVLDGSSVQKTGRITFLDDNLSGKTLLEKKRAEDIVAFFSELKKHFDIVIVDLAILDSSTNAKEWISFVDNYCATVEAGTGERMLPKDVVAKLNADPKFLGWLFTNA